MLEKIIGDFVTIWTTIDPISNLASFAGLTAAMPRTERRGRPTPEEVAYTDSRAEAHNPSYNRSLVTTQSLMAATAIHGQTSP